MAAIKRGDAPLSAEKNSGARPALTEEQRAICFGRVLSREKVVDLETVRRWIQANLGVDVSIATISRHKDQMGMSFQLVGRRGMAPSMTREEYVLGYFEFVQYLRDTGFFEHDPRHIVCVDFVTDSRRREYERTLALKGAKQRKIARDAPQYTSSYLVGVTMDKGQQLLPLMFTFDPTFDPKGPRRYEVIQWCLANRIRRDQIYFQKSDRKYCKESQAQVVEFSRVNGHVLRAARILHDQGGAFKKDGEFVFEIDGADRVVAFPAEQHGELSVLDNKLNAVAKHKWRQHRHNGDFSWDAFVLLVELSRVKQSSISKWWRHNFLLDVPTLTVAAVEERLRAVKNREPLRQRLSDYYEDCYTTWTEEHNEVELGYEGDEALGGLDGEYWK